MKKISFLIPSYNTLDHLTFVVNNILDDLDKTHQIVVVDDGSQDGSKEWLESLDEPRVKCFFNEVNKGIPATYNKAVELADNECILLCHTDMYFPPGFDDKMLKHLEKFDFVTSFRVEPPMYPPSNDKIQHEFGRDCNEFKKQEFLDYVEMHEAMYDGEIQPRTCFPWLTTKTVFNRIGKVDPIFAKYMVDDDDLYLRLVKYGYSYVQPLDVLMYHFCSKSTKFKETEKDTNTQSWNDQYSKSINSFIRKWHRMPGEVYNSNNSINNFNYYDIYTVLKSPNTLLEIAVVELISTKIVYNSEDVIIVPDDSKADDKLVNEIPVKKLIDSYIHLEQPNTIVDLNEKFITTTELKPDYDALLLVDYGSVNVSELIKLTKEISRIIDNIGHTGEYTIINGVTLIIRTELNENNKNKIPVLPILFGRD